MLWAHMVGGDNILQTLIKINYYMKPRENEKNQMRVPKKSKEEIPVGDCC